jgi:kinesin family member C2/C3
VYVDASPLVTSVLDGYNVCIFAYGQIGIGKTFTMEVNESNSGVNYRTLEELFNIAEERKGSVTYDFSVSVLEVYIEQIGYLLFSWSICVVLYVVQFNHLSYFFVQEIHF